jgi:hypothetical protein
VIALPAWLDDQLRRSFEGDAWQGATYRVVQRRLAGESAQLTPDEDWQQVPEPTEANWRATIDRLATLNRELREAVRAFPVERLDQPLVPSPTYAAITQFIGITQHDLYHAGQIVLLKRAMEHGHLQ